MKPEFGSGYRRLSVFLKSWGRDCAGHAAVAVLRGLRLFPSSLLIAVGDPLLPAYIRLRRKHTNSLGRKWSATPWSSSLSPSIYYRMRLRLYAANLQLHGRPLRSEDFSVTGLHYWQAALESGRPVLLVGHHLGPVEYLHRVAAAMMGDGKSLHVLTASAFAAPLTRFMRRDREKFGARMIYPTEAASSLRKILRRGGVAALMLDQTAGVENARFALSSQLDCPFNWRPVEFMLRHGAWVVPVAARLQGSRTQVDFGAPLAGSQDKIASHRNALEEFALRACREAPEQFNWSYPRLRLTGNSR